MGVGFKHGAGGSVGKALGTLIVNAPAGVTATATKDGKVYTKTVDDYGTAVFKNLTTGEWTVTIDNGEQTSTQRVIVTLDYSIVMAFFASTISVVYPVGATCTCSDGITTLTAFDTSGSHIFTVPNTGLWTIEIRQDDKYRSQSVEITEDGQSKNVNIAFFAATISVTYPEGSVCAATDGTTTLTAPDTSGLWDCIVPNTGSWVISCTNGSANASTTVEISVDGERKETSLSYQVYIIEDGYIDFNKYTYTYKYEAWNSISSSFQTYTGGVVDTAVKINQMYGDKPAVWFAGRNGSWHNHHLANVTVPSSATKFYVKYYLICCYNNDPYFMLGDAKVTLDRAGANKLTDGTAVIDVTALRGQTVTFEFANYGQAYNETNYIGSAWFE